MLITLIEFTFSCGVALIQYSGHIRQIACSCVQPTKSATSRHVLDCTKRVMKSDNATIQMYGELLSPGEQYPYSEVVMQHRLENERLLESIVRTFLQTDEVEIYMSRFGARMVAFGESGLCQDAQSPQACNEFSALCAKVVSACDNFDMRRSVHSAVKKTMTGR